jgi:hypothetical protein
LPISLLAAPISLPVGPSATCSGHCGGALSTRFVGSSDPPSGFLFVISNVCLAHVVVFELHI